MTRYATIWAFLLVAVSRTVIGSFLGLATLPATSLVEAAEPARPAGAAKAPEKAGDSEVDALIRALEDPDARGRLIAALKQEGGAAPAAAEDETLVESFGSVLLRQASETIAALGSWRNSLRESLGDPRGLVQRIGEAMQDPAQRGFLVDLLLQVGLAVGAGLAASGLVGLAARGPRRRVQAWPQPTWPWRLSGLLVHFLADLAQVGALAALGYVVITAVQFGETERLCALAVVNAMVLARLGCAVARLGTAPFAPSLRLWS